MDLKELLGQFKEELKRISSFNDLEAVRLKYVGKKGLIARMLEEIVTLSIDEKKALGQKINEVKQEIQAKIAELQDKLTSVKKETALDKFVKTLPGKKPAVGHLHIISPAIEGILEIF